MVFASQVLFFQAGFLLFCPYFIWFLCDFSWHVWMGLCGCSELITSGLDPWANGILPEQG